VTTSISSRRVLLLGVAAVMCAAAALAIGILLFGDFGGTEGRILITTILLAVFGALAVPAAVLWDQRRLPLLAASCTSLAAAGAAANIVGVWADSDSETFGKVSATIVFALLPTVVTAALAARPRHRLFPASVALAYLAAALATGAMWAETENETYLRVLGAVLVLAVLLVALQPLLLRARRERVSRPLRLVDDTGRSFELVVESDSAADAAARAIRNAERQGRHVRSLELLER
jgi:hypothetical protein